MSNEVPVAARPSRSAEVSAAAGLLAQVLSARVRPARPHVLPQSAREVVDVVRDEQVVGMALDADAPDEPFWRFVGSTTKPMLLVPAHVSAPPARLGRVLLPLDGTEQTTRAVTAAMALLDSAGIDLVLLHVFDDHTVPPAWDHPEHAAEVWRAEFALRQGAPSPARVMWRSGVAAANVVDVASAEHCDLVVLAWSQHVEGGRAATVRRTVGASTVPVLLLPVDTSDGW